MKKVLCIVLCLIMCLSAVACGKSSSSSDTAPGNDNTNAQQTVYTIKLAYTPGNMEPEDSPDIMYAYTFKDYVEEKSNGAIKVELYPSGQLGSASEVIQGIIAGTVEMTIVNLSMLNTLYDKTMVLSIPGLFSSVDECNDIINGNWGKNLSDEVRSVTGIRILNMTSNGFRHFTTSNKELRTVDDAKGVTFRVMESPVYIKMVEALGAKAVPMPGSEMYVAMQNGVVDGQENPILNIIQDLTYEVQKYLVLDGHVASIMAFVMNDQFYNELPDELKKVIDEAAAKALVNAEEVIENKNNEGLEFLKEKGMIIYEPTPEELKEWHETVFGPTQELVRTLIGDEIVD
ncbi:MAG: TRAP transporter substrate-binding protein, partial [Tepidanaerobacteraceae bacterium]